jgi:hypothetical protein
MRLNECRMKMCDAAIQAPDTRGVAIPSANHPILSS